MVPPFPRPNNIYMKEMASLNRRQSLERPSDATLASNTRLTVSPSMANVFTQPMDIHLDSDSNSFSAESLTVWSPTDDHDNHKARVTFATEQQGVSFSSTSTPQINNHSNERRRSIPPKIDRRSSFRDAVQLKSQRREARKTLNKRMGQAHPSLRGYQYVIFPERKSTQLWDLTIILFTVYNAFWIPYQFGMSGGYYKLTSNGFVIFSFVVDLWFFGEALAKILRIYWCMSHLGISN